MPGFWSSKDRMLRDSQIRIIRRGRITWNKWRKSKPGVQVDLSGEDLREADLRSIDLRQAKLIGTDFRRANLTGANLSLARLNGANLTGAKLREADFDHANLRNANLSQTYLTCAKLTRASLYGTNLSGADLTDANFAESQMAYTILGNVDLSSVKGLDTILHRGPSTIGIDTIHESKGRIPDEFLRDAGVPELFIAEAKSLVAVNQSILFYSCFISYSSKDAEFSERLHADLRTNGVRCWFAPEDLKIGDPLRSSFNEAIRLHDRLLVVLSKSSANSPWVKKEVETAFEKERQQKRIVLFPIRLDDAVMKTKQAWAADIRRTRHIGDFRDWKDHDSYKKAFERLLRDLKSDAKVESAAQNK